MFGTHLAEAITAIYVAVTLQTEGHGGVGATLGAHDLIHLPGRILLQPTVTLLGPPERPAAAASFGLIGKTS